MVYFGNSGSEAIETCLKFARGATGKRRLLYADHSYHGVSFGALSVTGHKMWRDGFEPLLPMTDMVPFGDVEALARELAKGDVAGILLEPIQVGAGIILPPDGYHKAVQDLCRKHKALFIMDEIHTGFGRTGAFLASERLGVEPDLIALSKGMSGAMVPVSAVVTRKDVIKGVYNRLDRSCVHASTFMGNNLAMIAGLATLHVLETEKLIEKGRERGEALVAALKPFEQKYELVKQVRGMGLLIGIEFGEPKSFMLKKAWSWMHKINPGLFAQAFTIPLMEKHAIMTQVAGHNEDVLKIAPALLLSKEDGEFLVRSLDEVIAASHSFPGPFWEVGSRLAKNALF
jgi:ornithine--oxo-acid transaminase